MAFGNLKKLGYAVRDYLMALEAGTVTIVRGDGKGKSWVLWVSPNGYTYRIRTQQNFTQCLRDWAEWVNTPEGGTWVAQDVTMDEDGRYCRVPSAWSKME